MQQLTIILEALMMVCFGASWPINFVKNYRLRSAKSTSCIFLWLVWLGYAAGVTARMISLFVPYLPSPTWYLLAIYFINLIMVSANLGVYYRNRWLDKLAATT